MAEAVIYPSEVITDFDKLEAVYWFIEQFRLWHNQEGAKVKLAPEKYKTKWYLYAQRPDKLGGSVFWKKMMPLLVEQDRLRRAIRATKFTKKQWMKLTLEQQMAEFDMMYGSKVAILKSLEGKTLAVTSPLLDELKAISLDSLVGELPPDPVEDFTTASWNNGVAQADPNTDLTIAANKVSVSTMRRDANAYFYSDRGVAHFGDFEHLVESNYTSGDNTALCCFWGLGNGAFTLADMDTANVGFLADYYKGATEIRLIIQDFSDDTQDYYVQASAGSRWHKIARSGTNFTDAIYSDEYTTLVDTLTVANCDTTTFRYVSAIASRDVAPTDANSITMYMQNLDLQEAAPPAGVPRQMDYYMRRRNN